MDTSVAPLGSLRCSPASLPDMRGAAGGKDALATSMDGAVVAAAADDGTGTADETRETDGLLLPSPGGPAGQSAGLAATTMQHPTQMITAALMRQASIDAANQRAAAATVIGSSQGGLAGTPLHTATNLNSSDDDDDSDEEQDDTRDTAEAGCRGRCCSRKSDALQIHLLLLGGSLGTAAAYVALGHEDLEFLMIPVWRWGCLASITVLGQVVSRILYWVVKATLSRRNQRLFEYYTLASELRAAGLLWFRIVIQGAAIATLLRGYPKDNETWSLAYVWIVRVLSWLVMLQSCRVIERIVSRGTHMPACS